MMVLYVFFGICITILLITAIDTKSNGFFLQERIGQYGKKFTIYKLRTLHSQTHHLSCWGKFLRNYKIDELPQLLNIIKGEMTLVGPRPDVPGYADLLEGDDRKILLLKPGITGLASLKYRNEETLLASMPNPQEYNDTIIYPDKVRLNLLYLKNKSIWLDLKICFFTLYTKNLVVEDLL
ncbi:sugar transferase [Flavobacterium sp.]|uniref:sugar transferase n=1 Tax=Flavobacterium sp. TaxID=239 RepID=UPI0033407A6E